MLCHGNATELEPEVLCVRVLEAHHQGIAVHSFHIRTMHQDWLFNKPGKVSRHGVHSFHRWDPFPAYPQEVSLQYDESLRPTEAMAAATPC